MWAEGTLHAYDTIRGIYIQPSLNTHRYAPSIYLNEYGMLMYIVSSQPINDISVRNCACKLPGKPDDGSHIVELFCEVYPDVGWRRRDTRVSAAGLYSDCTS